MSPDLSGLYSPVPTKSELATCYGKTEGQTAPKAGQLGTFPANADPGLLAEPYADRALMNAFKGKPRDFNPWDPPRQGHQQLR